ncbi:EAL domain-containing protein [Peribacillus acanthi]|uniref:EAL domain-containing protein n=1 Tax=Peribacillus acanthi TaxID=2171554 RepID=UPI000D3EAD94|nr:EAL domain-containing protein [Peribacillus acanthi]
MVCDVCSPNERGYTIYFAENQNTRNLIDYFKAFPDDKWKFINDRMFWAIEEVFYDLMDYIEAHMDINSIHAVVSSVLDPLKELHAMKPIYQFKSEREASWIDDLIESSSISTHYQPIVSVENDNLIIVGHELLSRGIGTEGEIISPFKMFEAARVRNRVFSLDRACRLQSVKNAGIIGDKLIFINFIPTAIYVPEHCLSTTFELVKKMNLKPEQIVFEVVESDEVKDLEHLKSILEYYRSHGFKYALDDVGVGFNDLKKLSQMRPDFVKLALEFTNGVSSDFSKQEVAREVLKIAHDMGALALAEGVEHEEDLNYLVQMGYDLFQGYYLAKPQSVPLESLNVKFKQDVRI